MLQCACRQISSDILQNEVRDTVTISGSFYWMPANLTRKSNEICQTTMILQQSLIIRVKNQVLARSPVPGLPETHGSRHLQYAPLRVKSIAMFDSAI